MLMNVTLSWIWLYHEYDFIIKWKRRGEGGGGWWWWQIHVKVPVTQSEIWCWILAENSSSQSTTNMNDPLPHLCGLRPCMARESGNMYYYTTTDTCFISIKVYHLCINYYTNFSFKKRLLTPLQWYQIIISQNLFFGAAGKNENGDNFHFSVYFGEKMNIDRN